MSHTEAQPLRGADRFSIERELADTLQGRIYAGTDRITGKQVVIKEAWRQLVHSGRSRKGLNVPEDFLKERSLIMTLTKMEQCNHGIVRGIDEWDDEHCYYYAMEYCEAELFDYVSKTHSKKYLKFIEAEARKPQRPMSEPNQWVKNVAKMFRQICAAVQFLHGNGYCHLDLSLENTMIFDIQQLRVKIIDLGLMQKFENNNFQHVGRVGKLQYMCPEAYARARYDARKADVYCLGVILFMMLIGAPPYQAPQPQNAAFSYLMKGRMADVLKHWKRLRLVTEDALDLLTQMVRYEEHRITLEQVLAHPFFNCVEQEANVDAVEHKANNTALQPSVDQLNAQISGMSVEQKNDDTNDSSKKATASSIAAAAAAVAPDCTTVDMQISNSDEYNDNDKKYERLLKSWGLGQLCATFHATGWVEPKDWSDLNEAILRLELGLNPTEIDMFIKNVRNLDHNNNNTQQQPPPQAQPQGQAQQLPQSQAQPCPVHYHDQQYQQYQQQQQQQQQYFAQFDTPHVQYYGQQGQHYPQQPVPPYAAPQENYMQYEHPQPQQQQQPQQAQHAQQAQPFYNFYPNSNNRTNNQYRCATSNLNELAQSSRSKNKNDYT